MTLVVKDNTTKNVIVMEHDNNMTKMLVRVGTLRRIYNNATIETYYGKVDNNPVTTIKTFN